MASLRFNQNALILSQFAQMKFKPEHCSLPKLKLQIDSKPSLLLHTQFSDQSNSNTSNSLNKRVKYLVPLNTACFLIGNENQIDLIAINGATFGFLDTEFLWSINLKKLILNLTVDTKKSFFALALQNSVQIYSYNPKKLNQFPILIKQIETKDLVKFIQFPKDSNLSLFYSEYFELFTIEQNGKIVKRCKKSYGLGPQYKIFGVPEAVDNILNIFFERESQKQNQFELWTLKLIFELVEVSLSSISKVYDISESLKKRVLLRNYSKDVFLLNMGSQIIAAKKGFVIDSISTNFKGENSKLISLSHNKVLYMNDNKAQLYHITLDLNIRPNRIKVNPLDSLEINQKPPNSQLLNVISLGKDNFAIFYQLKPQHNCFRKGDITYWFVITQNITIEQKIRTIFNYGAEISNLQPQIIQTRCDMARKLGLSNKEIFLQIWNRTSKNTLNDYKYLLATKDFKTIYSQIQKKLKKHSMSFRELINIFQSCLDILSKSVFSKDSENLCTEETIQEYLTCHLLVRKLRLYKQMQIYARQNQLILTKSETEEQSSLFIITIQSFYEYKNLDIKGFLIDHVNMFCTDKKNTIHKIRLILRAFKFIYRIIYRQLLDEIIANAKTNLLTLLQAIPELLPLKNQSLENEQHELYEGIWNQIKDSEWLYNLHLQNTKTIYNSKKLNEVIQSVWYKRNWLTAHDFVNLTKQQIFSINQKNNSSEIFYHFISSIFSKIQDARNIEVIIEFIENYYDNFPQHIKGKIFLYVDLWKYYCRHYFEVKRNSMLLNEFFVLKAPNLFKYFFDLEKVRKNCILKEIKPIYLKSKTQFPGTDVFNQGLLEYFQSSLSEISDLKYLLNRMNNQKSQFHGHNADTYEILVQAMQIKLIIGGKNDVPIEQTLIYIENIPLSKDHHVMSELETVQRINEQSERFRKMNLNMSIRQIIDNCEDVIFKVTKYEFENNRVYQISQINELKRVSYSILADVQTLKQKIYGETMNNLPFFIFVSQLLENENQIQMARELLGDEFLNRYFAVNDTVLQNLVLFMYKKRFSISSVFRDHEKYVKKLLELLAQDNNTRRFIESEFEFALLLSSENYPVRFPLSQQYAFPKVNELHEIVHKLPGEFLIQVDIERVYKNMMRMQQIEMVSAEDDQSQQDQYMNVEIISQHAVYEVFITRLIDLKFIHEALKLIKKINQIQVTSKAYNNVFLIMLVTKIAPQLNDQSKQALINLVMYNFDQLEEIIKIITFYATEKITSLQKGTIISQKVNQLITDKHSFTFSQNSLFKQAFIIEAKKSKKLGLNANLLIQSTWNRLKITKPQFQSPLYKFIFIILCHQPYMLAKLIYLELQSINLKTLRSFISYLTVQQIFDELKVLQLARRVFYSVLYARTLNQEINHKLSVFQKTSLDQVVHLREFNNLTSQTNLKLLKSIKACENKSKIILNPIKASRDKGSDKDSIHIKINFPENITQSSPSQYPYPDSDDERDQQDNSMSQKVQLKEKRSKIEFDQKSQRNKFIKREGKKIGNYMKQNAQTLKQSQTQSNQGQKTFKIRSRIASMSQNLDKQSKISRAMTLTFTPQQLKTSKNQVDLNSEYELESPRKRTVLNLNPTQNEAQQSNQQQGKTKKKILKRKSSEQINTSILRNEEDAFMKNKQKQSSSYMLREQTSIRKSETYEKIIDGLLEEYESGNRRFNMQKLGKRRKKLSQNSQQFKNQLQNIIRILFENIENETKIRAELIKQIVSNFQQSGVKLNVLSVYIQMIMLLPKYNLNLSAKNILPIDALFKYQNLSDLFEQVKQRIVEISTLENLSKLSKVVALSFRKNIYEQQLAYLGLSKILNELNSSQDLNQVEVNLYFDEIYQILSKISTKMLRQKAQRQFVEISNGPLKNRLIQMIITMINNKGDKISVNALKKSLNLE